MKNVNRILIIIMIFSLILSLTISCSEPENKNIAPNTNTDEEDTAVTENETQPPKKELDLPEADYGEYQFKIINIDQPAMTWVYTTIYTEEENGEGINDAVFARNLLVEERFNIRITELTESSSDTIRQKASQSIQAGSDDYDLIMVNSSDAVTLAKQHLLFDYNDIPYVDLIQPWWDRDMVRDLSINGRNYIVAGDFSMMHYGDTIGMFFNKKLIEDLNLESPYDIINSGKWTYDKFSEMAKDASYDLNGDGLFDKNDQFGYMSLTHIWSPGFLASAGQNTVVKDENDLHVFAMDNEKFINVYQKMIEVIHYDNMTFDADTAGDHRLQDIMFPNNQALFWSEVVHWATILRNMDADFGIIVHPKWDEAQTNYHNYVFPPPVMSIPVTATDISRTGMIIEALCYESTDTVIKAYYEELLKTKISRDNESEKMLDIMFQNRSYNLANIFYSNEIYNPLNSQGKNKSNDIVSWIQKNEGIINGTIEKTNAAFIE